MKNLNPIPQKLFRTCFALLFLSLALLAFGIEQAQAATYYSKSSNTAPATTSNWSSTRDGTGGAPANFTTAGDVFVIQGTGNGGTTPHTLTGTAFWTVTGTVQVENGATLNQGDGTTSSATALFTNGVFQIDNGGTYVVNYKHGTSGSANSIPGTTKTFGASSTVEIKLWGDGTGTSPNALPSGVSWGNLTINVPTLGGSWNQSGGVTTINGNFTIKATGGGANEFRLTSTTIYTLTIGGDLLIQGGVLSGYSSSAILDGSAIKLYGNYNQSAGTTFKTTSSTTGGILNFTFDNTGGPSSVNFTMAGSTFQVNRVKFFIGAGKNVTLNTAFPTGSNSPTNAVTVSGTLLCNGFNVTGAEPFTLAAGGTLGITDANGITSSGATGNIQTTGTRTFDSAANYIYYGSGASAVTGNGLPATVNNLTLNNANGVTLSQNVQVNGTMSMTAGAVTLGANTLSYGASGTLLYNGSSSQTTAAAEFPAASGPANLTITNSSGVILNFARSIAGTLTLASGNLTTTAANLLTIGSAGGSAGGSASSYVSGPLARIYGGTGSKNFPTGASPNFRQVTLNLTGISGTPTITVTPNEPSAWVSPANDPASTTMYGTRDWTVNSSGAGNTATLTLDGTGFTPSGAARIVGYNGVSTSSYTPTFVPPNYTATGISLASGNNEIALGDLACAAPATSTFSSVTAPGCSPVSVIWNAASGAATYDLFRKISGDSYPVVPLASGLTVTNYSDSDITNAVTYVYQVKAYSACGASSLSADSTGVTPTTAPFITTNSAGYVGYEGFSATFAVGARGDGLTYQWQVNKGSGFANVDTGGADGSGGTTATFTTVNATTSMNSYQYRCVVSGTCSPPAISTAGTLSLGTQFRSLATGGWAANSSWQLSADGSVWVNAPAGVYPGATAGHTDAVRVQAGHVITVAPTTTVSAGALTIDATGKISLGDQASTTDGNTLIQIAGNFANNGTITASQGNGNRIIFAGTTTWTGSGDITAGGSGKMGFTVNAGATLNLSVDVTLRNSTGQAPVTINGSLYAGTHIIKQATASATSNTTFTVGPGATVETANAGGIGGATNTTSGTFQSQFGLTVLDPSANYIFDGTVNQSAVSGSATVITAANNLTIRNTGSGGNNTVTMGTIAMSGILYVQNGLVSFGSTTTSTAGGLTFDNATYQAGGTWGSSSSAASNPDNTHFVGTGYVTITAPVAISSSTQFRSHTSGNWNVAGTWEASADNGASWTPVFSGFTPGSTPGSTHKVYVQVGHTVTLTENEACNDINMSVGSTSSTTGGSGGKVACVTNTLSVNGQLRGYWAPVSTTPGTDQSSASAFDPFTKTDVGGKVKIVGSGRVILAAGQWGNYNITTTPASPGGCADWEFALTSGQTGTNLSSFRVANITIDSGTTLDIYTNVMGACGNGGLGVGTGGAGNITISNGATLISSGTGVIARRSTTASSGTIGTFANQGALKLSGAAPLIAAAAYDFSGGTVEYNGTGQTLLSRDPATTSTNQVDPSAYNHLILSGSGAKLLSTNTTVNGTLTVSSGATLDFNGKTITVASAPSLSGSLTMEVNKTAPNTFTGSQFVQSSGTLAYGGSLTVTASGTALALNDSIPLFVSAGGFGGGFSSVTGPTTPAGLARDATQLTGGTGGNLTITCDGSFVISTASLPNGTYGSAYNQTVSASGATGFGAGGLPLGLSIDSGSGLISGTPTAIGASSVTLTATNALGCTDTKVVSLTVDKATTVVGLASSSPTNGYRASVFFTATLPTFATGSVNFLANGTPLCTSNLVNGSATSLVVANLPRGANTITVEYAGDANCLGSTNTLTQTVTNHPPVANGNSYTRNGMSTWKIAVTNLLANASDADGDTLSLVGTGASTNGITLVVAGGYLEYANTNLVNDQFSYTVTDGFGGTNSALITLTVGSSNGLGGQVNSFTVTGGTASMSFAGIPGYLYNVQVSTNVTDWNTIWTTNAPSGGLFHFNDSAAPQPNAYYRLMWNGN